MPTISGTDCYNVKSFSRLIFPYSYLMLVRFEAFIQGK